MEQLRTYYGGYFDHVMASLPYFDLEPFEIVSTKPNKVINI